MYCGAGCAGRCGAGVCTTASTGREDATAAEADDPAALAAASAAAATSRDDVKNATERLARRSICTVHAQNHKKRQLLRRCPKLVLVKSAFKDANVACFAVSTPVR
jgi:hypothetical protein